MRITTFIIGIQAFFTTALLASTIHAQNIHLDFKQASITRVFSAIEKQTNFTFVYNDETLKGLENISIRADNKSLREVLALIGAKLPLTFQQTGNVIGVDRVNRTRPKEQPGKVGTTSPPITVSGNVSDEKGQSLPGVTVRLSDNSRLTTTDANGNFSIVVPSEKSILVFSYIGYKNQEITVGTQRTIKITLASDPARLDEVHVIAYGTTTQRLSTGSISKVSSQAIEEQPVTNPLAALEGRVSGMTVTQATGAPGSGFTVRIRGLNSIAAGNDPLFVIDGVPYQSAPITSVLGNGVTGGTSPLNLINPSDIESIEVLKDADATAIYGSRGANGVILITTKKGVAGKTSVSANFYEGASKVTRMMDLLNTPQYLQMRHEAFKNDGESPSLGNGDYDLLSWDTTRYTDWQKLLIGNTAHSQDAEVSLTGGSQNTQFLVGGAFHHETTVFPGDFGESRGSMHFSINHVSENNKFNLHLTGSYTNDHNNLSPLDPTQNALELAPDAPAVYGPNGSLNWSNGTFANPFGPLQQTYTATSNNLLSNMLLSYQILPGLLIKSNMGFNSVQVDEINKYPVTSFNPSYGITKGSAYFASNNIRSWIIEPQLEYSKSVGKKGRLKALLGATFQQNITDAQRLNASGYTNDALLGSIAAASSVTVSASGTHYYQYRYQAVFGRLNYDWAGKYLLDLTGRRDGSSRFGPDREFANFGAIGAAWIFSEEDFLRNKLGFIDYGKLRASYGITGNDQIADYGYLSTYSSTSYPYGGISGLVPSRLLNPDYSWETNRKLELAIELGMFKDRILVSANYYRNRSSNQLVGYALPSITGFTSIQSNLPAEIQNTGFEFDIKTTNIKSSAFKWTTGFNLTIPKNKLLAYPNIEGSSYYNYYVVGKSLFIADDYQYTGVNPQTGTYQFRDVDGDGQVSFPNDVVPIKQLTQTYYGGFENDFTYHSFALEFLFQFVKQDAYDYMSFFGPPGSLSNQPVTVLKRWQKPGDVTTVQMFSQDGGSAASSAYYTSQGYGDNVISDASFIRLKNLSLSYNLPEKATRLLHLQKCRLYLQGQNLLTFTNYIGLDPENQFNLPPLKTYTLGIQATF